jgi:hypothetical protein
VTIYVNGVNIRSQPLSGNLYRFLGSRHRQGDPDFSSGEYFRGLLDEIRVWNVARSSAKIQAAMDETLTGKEAGSGLLDLEDGAANDLSGHGNHGRLKATRGLLKSQHQP